MCVQVSIVTPLLGAARQRRDPTVAQVAAGPSHRWSRSVIKCTCWVISQAEFLLTQCGISVLLVFIRGVHSYKGKRYMTLLAKKMSTKKVPP